jgi:hypothetical protein
MKEETGRKQFHHYTESFRILARGANGYSIPVDAQLIGSPGGACIDDGHKYGAKMATGSSGSANSLNCRSISGFVNWAAKLL